MAIRRGKRKALHFLISYLTQNPRMFLREKKVILHRLSLNTKSHDPVLAHRQ